ncbi:DUF4124 domain-containing protein [Paracidovorax valerianellae]|uniref:DUF4124 domain-containing protein n=1 Tax=Paracidovorax valerianellae TaxID=187868 RepID=A0A1G6M3D6_9BURK|nr:DUF4124 domain-containing protein [Paracidovorax valerianellae]MDA8446097.1 DUF4124 domain-containing protein [Paracidovorax valerianellae]SDC49961.1 protein of unknown function [Paracidovorax valerianellae]
MTQPLAPIRCGPAAWRLCAALAVAACASLSGPVQAQVMRCTDPGTGKVTYTDGACDKGTAVREVESRKTPEEIQEERAQAREALQLKQQRLQIERQEAQQEARQDRERSAARVPADPSRSPECARSRRNLDRVANESGLGNYDGQARMAAAQRQMDLDCLGPQGYAEVERARGSGMVSSGDYYAPPAVVVVPPRRPVVVQPALPVPSAPISHCNVFRCYDQQGNVRPR